MSDEKLSKTGKAVHESYYVLKEVPKHTEIQVVIKKSRYALICIHGNCKGSASLKRNIPKTNLRIIL